MKNIFVMKNNFFSQNKKITYITTQEELEKLINVSNQLVILCYSDWCPISQISSMDFENLANEYYTRYTFAKIIVDEFPLFHTLLNIQAIPTYLFFKDKKFIGNKNGYIPYQTLKKAIKNC